ncbi:hypothetical protein M513_04350 [Trichuris suis]|uniref:Reverse transcriptase domain-containing protein n=2 Tax=Trichuris suis TaxID=68888 RepID=A0A085MBQ4_9BILA|nr:hypothetical protein M513_04350 [Trichuris suis]
MLKNCRDFCSAIKSVNLKQDSLMVSYDVKDLFTSIPISCTLKLLEDLLKTDTSRHLRTKLNPFHILKLVSFCMKEGNYFRFQDSFFSQQDGAPMGSPLSPVLAEVFMEHLEEKAFTSISTSDAPIFFKRYVDDIFAITTVGKEETFLEHLNSLYPTKIKLTMEKEVDNKLPFLDVLVIKQGNNFKTTVYRKPTHSDRYLHFTSHHPMAVKRGIVKGMVDRAHAICDPTMLQSELRHITHALTANGYPNQLVNSIIAKCARDNNNTNIKNSTTNNTVLFLPYYNGVGERILKLAHSLNFKVRFTSSHSLRSIVRSDKIKVPFAGRPGVVYNIRCGCNASYIGETGNTLLDRYKRHMSNVGRYKEAVRRLKEPQTPARTSTKRRGRPQREQPQKIMAETIKASAVVEHSSQCSHDLQPSIICRESRLHLRRVKEALFIRNNRTINRDKGVEVSAVWDTLISKRKCCSLPG